MATGGGAPRACSRGDAQGLTGPGDSAGLACRECAQGPVLRSPFRRAAGTHESEPPPRSPPKPSRCRGLRPHLGSVGRSRSPEPVRSPTCPPRPGRVSERSVRQPQRLLALPQPSPVCTLFPGVALFPAARSHSRPPLPALPASDPVIGAPVDLRKLLGAPDSGAASRPRMPPALSLTPPWASGLAGSAPITALATTRSGGPPWQPAETGGGAPLTPAGTAEKARLRRAPAGRRGRPGAGARILTAVGAGGRQAGLCVSPVTRGAGSLVSSTSSSAARGTYWRPKSSRAVG